MSKQRSFRPRSKLSFEDDEGQEAAKPAGGAGSGGGAAAAAVAEQKPAALPKQPRVSSKPNLLSFDDDGAGGDDTAVGAASKRKDKDRGKKLGRAVGLPELPAVAASQPSSAGEYTAERIKELQRNTLSFSAAKFSVKQDADGVPAPAAAAPLIKLSGSFKPAGQPKDDRFTINPTALVRDDLSRDKGPSKGQTSPAQAAAKDSAAAAAQPVAGAAPGEQGAGMESAAAAAAAVAGDAGEEEDVDDGPVIPDEDTIRLAKAKRERLRQAHLAPDYIPLGGTSKLLASSKAGGKAPDLGAASEVAGGGESGDSDAEAELEEHMRIKFSVKGESGRSDRKGYAKSLAISPEDDEQAFAEEQLRKAVRRNQAAMPHSASAPMAAGAAYSGAGQYASDMQYSGAAYQAAYVEQPAYYGTDGAAAITSGYGMASGKASGGTLARSRMEAILQASVSAVSALRDGVAALTASHKTAKSNLNKTHNLLSQGVAKIEGLEQDSKVASEKYVYIQQFRTYIADLLDCLADKSVLVEELEDSLMELREERAAGARTTMQALEEEMLRPAQAAITAALGVLGRGGALPAALQAAQNAADAEEDAIEDEASGGPEELDEFGRNVNIGKRREAQDRRRQRQAALKQEGAYLKAVAAGSPASQQAELEVESEVQAARYATRHQEIMALAGTVFADAAEEFSTLQAVKARLEEFKARYPKDYGNIYMHLSCPALFSPYVRLELLQWDPLYADQRPASDHPETRLSSLQEPGDGSDNVGNGSATAPEVHKGFDKQAWYENLFDYGMGSDPSAMAADDPDAELVPQLVRKLVLPLATHMLVKCWDPLVMPQCQAAAAVVGDLLVYVPAEEAGMSELLDAVVSALTAAVARVSLPPWPPVALAAAPMAEAVLSRRFRSAVRLLRGLGVWEGLLSRQLLLSLALDKVVVQQLMHYLRAAASAASVQPHTAVARMEAVANALTPEWFAGGCPPEAAPFMELMHSLANNLESQRDNRASLAGPASRLARALQRLGEQQRASRLASAFGLAL